MSYWKWSTTAATNATADSTINWAEGQAPSSVNDSARAMMAAAAKWRDDTNGTLTTGGTSTAYTVTSNSTYDTLAHMDGAILAVKIHTDSGASPTLNVDSLGAKAINLTNGSAVPTGYLKAGTRYLLSYDNSNNQFLVINPFVAALLTSGIITTTMLADSNVTYAKIQNVNPGKILGGSFAPGGSAAAPAEKTVPFGQVQLTKSGSNLLLSPYAGNLVTINSKVYAVPDAGITLGTGGLAASTVYYIYAYDNSGTLTLEASATAYATQAGTGIKSKNGDVTRTLVGLARTDGSTAWADSVTQRFVRSWFNNPGVALLNSFSADRTFSSAGYTEINSEIRIEFLVWTGETMHVNAAPVVAIGSGSSAHVSIGFDGATAEDVWSETTNQAASSTIFSLPVTLYRSGLGEGYHYATLLGKSSGSTQTAQGSGSAGARTTLRGYARL